MYSSISEMEPLMPSYGRDVLIDKITKILSISNSLGTGISEKTVEGIAELVQITNSYYSNLIEGNKTTPLEIEKAMRKDFSAEPAKREKALEHVANINVQRKIDTMLKKDPGRNICTIEFIKWIHKEFYSFIPDEFRIIKRGDGTTANVIPGEIRNEDVIVGEHVPPEHKSITNFLERFCRVYSTDTLGAIDKIIAAAASHHRLAWIHPFIDGNGRVVRLFTHAYMLKAGINPKGLWSVSRGFARKVNDYYGNLTKADASRRNDLDGRGNLSDRGLFEFCNYFFDIAIDQIEFMSALYELHNVTSRIKKYVDISNDLPEGSYEVLKECFIMGEVKRGEALKLTRMPERTARRVIAALIEKKLLASATPKGALRMCFPVEAAEYYFPRLFPAL